ncbi:MAG: hypothetical protein JRI55_15475 [Deltaproteobacteria bacterium]|nr:hypothetical protein [Deltaproteobacteria bacterium]
MLPISLGGLGVREGVIVYFFVGLGVATSDAVSLSFVVYFNRILVALIGGAVQAVWKPSAGGGADVEPGTKS